jgi:uncharacterized lipoprotein YddW (UPF0748 family)
MTHGMDYPEEKLEDRLLQKAPRGFHYASPCVAYEEVRQYNIKRILGLVEKYPDVDGIHIDWVGQEVEFYHGPAWVASCYCDACRDGFRRDHGLDPLEIARDSSLHPGMVDKWKRWRLEMVNRYVKELGKTVKGANTDLAFSATAHQTLGHKDVVDGPYACSGNFQEWGRWMAEGWMNFFTLMAYTCDNAGFRQHLKQVRRAEALAGDKSFAYVGIGQSYLVDEEQLPQQIEIIRNHGISGFAIFMSMPSMKKEKGKWVIARMESAGEHWWKTLEEFLTKPPKPPHSLA